MTIDIDLSQYPDIAAMILNGSLVRAYKEAKHGLKTGDIVLMVVMCYSDIAYAFERSEFTKLFTSLDVLNQSATETAGTPHAFWLVVVRETIHCLAIAVESPHASA